MSNDIRVLFFAGARDRVGRAAMDIPISQALTVRSLKETLANQFDTLTGLLPHVAWAVNEEYATEEKELKAGDTVAVIPPVSGG